MFEELRTFVEVAESKNFTRTAQKLNFSQPTVSQQVKKVEIFFGNTVLLTRSPSSKLMELTEEGVAAYRFAKKVLSLLDDTFQELNQIRENKSGKQIRIGASMTIGNFLLPRLLKKFCENCPDVAANVLTGNTRQICDALNHEEIDVGLIEGKDIPHSFRRTAFYTDQLILAASPETAAEIPEFSASKLEKLLWITREEGSGTEQYFDSFLQSNHIRVNKRITYNSNFAIKEVVKEGLGVTFLSQLVMENELKSGQLVRLPMNKAYTREFSFILPENKPCGPTVRSFLEILAQHA